MLPTAIESGPCTSPGRDSEAGPGGVSVDELDPRAREQGNWLCSLPQAALGGLAETVLESSPGW